MGVSALEPVNLDAAGMKLAIVAARFNEHITKPLVEGALEKITELGGSDVGVYWVPGAFEIPLIAKEVTAKADAVICVGAIVRGDTAHFEYVAGPCADACAQISVDTGVPIAFGVLTTNTEQQAFDRCGGSEGNKGAEAAATAIEMVQLLRALRGGSRESM